MKYTRMDQTVVISLENGDEIHQSIQPVTIYSYNQVILAHLGEDGLSAFAACTYLLLIVMGVFLGVSQGIQPLLGNSFGDGRREDVLYFFRSALFINVAITTNRSI